MRRRALSDDWGRQAVVYGNLALVDHMTAPRNRGRGRLQGTVAVTFRPLSMLTIPQRRVVVKPAGKIVGREMFGFLA